VPAGRIVLFEYHFLPSFHFLSNILAEKFEKIKQNL
jgi:hypothetical protein